MPKAILWGLPALPHALSARCARLFATAQRQFLFFGSIAAIVLLALIPPLAGGNETNNLMRVAGIAAGHPLVEPASVPGGVVRLLQQAYARLPEGAAPPYHYSLTEIRELAAIPLAGNKTKILRPNPVAVLNPVAYGPQVAAYWLGEAWGLPPLALFYMGRIAGAIAGVCLTYFAIRRMPVHRYALCALALLPTIVFSRSTLDADQVTNGLAFFFTANVFAAMVGRERISARAIVALAITAFATAQCKSAYLVLLPIAVAIPAERYGSRARWLLATALIVLPGILASIAWMVALKHTYFAGIHYRTYAGIVYPDGQMQRMLAHPLSYAMVLLRTIFASALVPETLLGFLGIFGPPVQLPPLFYGLLLGMLILVMTGEGDDDDVSVPSAARWLSLCAFAAGFLLILTLLYIQWDGLGATVVEGFQGRYLYPLAAPLLILLPRGRRASHLGLAAPQWTAALGITALLCTVFVTWSAYWV